MKLLNRTKSRISVDGRHFVGRSLEINGDKVIIDGIEQSGSLDGPISVSIYGDIESFEGMSGDVSVSVRTVSGSSGEQHGVQGAMDPKPT
jgi:hypothetical protein